MTVKQQSNAPGSIWKELSTSGYLGRARARAQQRKSPWNLLLIPLVLGGLASVTYSLFQVMWSVHTFFYPEHINRLGEFWGRGIGALSFISSFLMVIPLFFAALPLSMIVANLITWCVPPARHAFELEGQAEPWLSFPIAMRLLGELSLVVVPICLFLSFIGAVTLRNLR